MKVHIYKKGFGVVGKSGVGKAMLHQEKALASAGVTLTESWKEADVVHFNTVFPNSFFQAIRVKIGGKKVVFYGHSTMEDFRNSFHGSNFFAPLFRFWIKACYKRGDVIITPSRYSKRLLESYEMEKTIYALSNGIDNSYFTPDPSAGEKFRAKYQVPSDQKVVICVGHYIGRKGILDFIELANRLPETQFVWFGHTNKNLIPKAISSAIDNAPANLLFPGYVNKEELREAYQGADCFAFLSHEETEGIVVLEALACEIPTVLRDIPVYDGWLENGKNVHMGRNLDELETCVRGVLDQSLTDLTRMGALVAKERDLTKIGEKLCEIYQKENFVPAESQ